MKTLMIAGAAAGLLGAAAYAQDDEADPVAALHAAMDGHVHELEVRDGALAGPGGDFLMARAAQAQFVAVGEQHATADIAAFARAWFAGLDGIGFDYMALEVGPYSTERAEELLRGEPGAFEADAAARANGMAYPFLFFAEEAALARDVVERHDGAAPALWGLDQEFTASGSILLELLRPRADTPAREAVIAEIDAALAEDPFLVGGGAQADWASWAEAWGEGDGADIFAAILESNRIYAPFTGRGGSGWIANQTRENTMKDRFAARFAAAEAADGAPPRVFLKFGGYHLARGRSQLHVATLGNFLAEWGRPRGFSLFNVAADCLGGEMRNPQSGETAPCSTPFTGDDNPFAAFAEDGPVVVDLEALRPHAARADGLDPAVVDLIFAYDAYIAFPDVAPATLVSAE